MLFAKKLAQTALIALLLSSLGKAEEEATPDQGEIQGVIELKSGDNVEELMTAHEFTIVSYYKSSDEVSKEVDSFLDGAKSYFERQQTEGDWPTRQVGWFRVDIDTYPDLAIDDSGIPDQLVHNPGHSMSRFLHFAKLDADTDPRDAEKRLALIMRELTGEWYREIPCGEIQAEPRFYYDEVVYFGEASDLYESRQGSLVNRLSMVDRYFVDQQRAGFYYNYEVECKKANNLEADKNYIVFYNGENSSPQHLVVDENLAPEQLFYTLNTSIIKGTPRWSQRALVSINDFQMTAVILLMEEGALTAVYKSMHDWRVALMTKVAEWTQDNETLLLPIIAQSEPDLLELIGDAKVDDLPHFYVYNPIAKKAVAYPDQLDEKEKYSPELIVAWANHQKILLTLEAMPARKAQIESDMVKVEFEYSAGEMKDYIENVYPKALKELEEAAKRAGEDFEILKASVGDDNNFVKNLEEHFDYQEKHMTRIERAIIEEEL